MNFNFDELIERRNTDSSKWTNYGPEVLPMWVADMDFKSPQPIIDALEVRVRQGTFGYGNDPKRLRAVLVDRMQQRYNWTIQPEDIVFLPGLVSGLNAVTRAFGERGDGALVTTPVYGPFLTAPGNQYHELQVAPLLESNHGRRLRYTVDVDALDAAVQPNTRLFILCNPHNPVGRSYTRAELVEMATFCEEHDLVICSDEIHCDLLLDQVTHIPTASLAPEIAERTITLMAPSKTFNVPGLGASFAIVTNPELRRRTERAMAGIVPHVNVLGMVAMEAAYTQCDEWLRALRDYLVANRDFAVRYSDENLPGVRTTCPEATYLLWLDFRATKLAESPGDRLLREARVAVNEGSWFGHAGEGFVRLNFGTPRSLLEEGLEQIRSVIAR